MRSRASRAMLKGLRDMALGAALFLMLPAITVGHGGAEPGWSLTAARAGEVIADHAVDVTTPAGPKADNAIIATAQMRPVADSLLKRRFSDYAILGLTFSLLVALNLAFLRHLRRVTASPRRSEWRRRRTSAH